MCTLRTHALMSIPILFLLPACGSTQFKGGETTPKPPVREIRTANFERLSALQFRQVDLEQKREKVKWQDALIDSEENWGALDLLVVIDNSGSMASQQATLGSKLDPLLSHVNNSDWQVAVVTTHATNSFTSPCYRDLIKKADPNNSAAFEAAINAGTSGSGNERGILAAVQGLAGDCAGASPWLRNGSSVAVLIVSDEDNCSIGESGCQGSPDAKSSYLTSYLDQIRTLGKDARVYGLYHQPGTQCTSAQRPAQVYEEAVIESQGRAGSICDADYSATLEAISEDVREIVAISVTFKFPDAQEGKEMTLLLDGEPVDESNVTIENGTIKLDFVPKKDQILEVEYSNRDELKSEFDLGVKDIGQGEIMVLVDGEETSSFEVERKTGILKFSTPPPSGVDIEVTLP